MILPTIDLSASFQSPVSPKSKRSLDTASIDEGSVEWWLQNGSLAEMPRMGLESQALDTNSASLLAILGALNGQQSSPNMLGPLLGLLPVDQMLPAANSSISLLNVLPQVIELVHAFISFPQVNTLDFILIP